MILRDLRQAAAELLCTERWLADGIRSGRFPAKKINRRWVLGEDDLAAILRICSVNQRTDRFIDDQLPGNKGGCEEPCEVAKNRINKK